MNAIQKKWVRIFYPDGTSYETFIGDNQGGWVTKKISYNDRLLEVMIDLEWDGREIPGKENIKRTSEVWYRGFPYVLDLITDQPK